MKDSTETGFITPTTGPLTDQPLDIILQNFICGLSGLQGELVRPRWQATVPHFPDINTNWCALGVTETTQSLPAIRHCSKEEGTSHFSRQERLNILISFYGPQSMHYATLVRDNLFIEQNHHYLTQNQMGLVKVGQLINAPEMTNNQWVRRYDLNLTITREISRVYPIRNLLSVQGEVQTETNKTLL